MNYACCNVKDLTEYADTSEADADCSEAYIYISQKNSLIGRMNRSLIYANEPLLRKDWSLFCMPHSHYPNIRALP